MGKREDKKRKRSSAVGLETTAYLSPISKPLADDKHAKKLLRLTKKGMFLCFFM